MSCPTLLLPALAASQPGRTVEPFPIRGGGRDRYRRGHLGQEQESTKSRALIRDTLKSQPLITQIQLSANHHKAVPASLRPQPGNQHLLTELPPVCRGPGAPGGHSGRRSWLDETGWGGWGGWGDRQSGRRLSNVHMLPLTQNLHLWDMPFKYPCTYHGTVTQSNSPPQQTEPPAQGRLDPAMEPCHPQQDHHGDPTWKPDVRKAD